MGIGEKDVEDYSVTKKTQTDGNNQKRGEIYSDHVKTMSYKLN